MVLKGVNWVHIIKLDQRVLKGVNWVHNTKQKSCHMVLKVVNWVHHDKIESYGLEKSQLSTQGKYQVIWSSKSQLSTQYKKYRGYLLR